MPQEQLGFLSVKCLTYCGWSFIYTGVLFVQNYFLCTCTTNFINHILFNRNMISQKRSLRRPTGGRYKRAKGKKKARLGNNPTLTKIGLRKAKNVRILGGNLKVKLLQDDYVNAIDPKTNKAVKLKIKTVVENPANRYYVRRNILTKGSIVETEKEKVIITSRPGQESVVQGVLVG